MTKYIEFWGSIITGIFLTLVLTSCSDSGEAYESQPYNPAWVEINSPSADPIVIDRESIYLSGSAFISDDWYRCCSGSPTDTGVTVTWSNLTTGTSASAHQYVTYSSFFGYVYISSHTWSADIPLVMGSNKIRITAYDPEYSNTDTITAIREIEKTPPVISSTIPISF